MRKIVVGIVFFTLLTLSITHLAEAQHIWKKNTITNRTNETIYVVWSTAYPAFGSVPVAGYRTSGWADIPAGQQKSYWAYSTHRIYFLILKGGDPVKPTTSTRTYATWINRNAHFNIVSEGEINVPSLPSQISYSNTSFGDTSLHDGFLRYANGSQITVTNNWVTLDDSDAMDGPVNIPDSVLRSGIEKALGKTQGAAITQADMLTLTKLSENSRGIRDLTGLEFATNLTELHLYKNQTISDVSPLAGLTKLTRLTLKTNQISDVSPLARLTKLTYLVLSENQISDVSPLAGLTKLTDLYLKTNQISDVSPLARLTRLRLLNLSENQISDVSPLARLTELESLYLYENQISDVSPLARLTRLRVLNLSENQISDVSPLAGLTRLTDLYLHTNQISDVSPLAGLTRLTDLYLYTNRISDFSPIAGLPMLEFYLNRDQTVVNLNTPVQIPDRSLRAAIEKALGKTKGATITPADMLKLTELNAILWDDIEDLTGLEFATNLTELDLSGNQISDLSPLAALKNLTKLDIAKQNIIVVDGFYGEIIYPLSDVSPLASLKNLTELKLWENRISDVSPLASLRNLTYLDLAKNRISDLSPLTALKNLTELNLWRNRISDLSPLTALKNLTYLDISSNSFSDLSSDLSPLASLKNLTELELRNNRISDVSPLAAFKNLTYLNLSSNRISDVSPLASLKNLTTLYLWKNSITDYSPLILLPRLSVVKTEDVDGIDALHAAITKTDGCTFNMPPTYGRLQPSTHTYSISRRSSRGGVSGNDGNVKAAPLVHDNATLNWTYKTTAASESEYDPTTITIRFLNGMKEHKDIVIGAAYSWESFGYLRFKFLHPGQSGASDIRVKFEDDYFREFEIETKIVGGVEEITYTPTGKTFNETNRFSYNPPSERHGLLSSSDFWSKYGTFANDYKGEETMHFTTNLSRMDALHELGHALGLAHEHLSPKFKDYFQWVDTEAVYTYFQSSRPSWTRRNVAVNVLNTIQVATNLPSVDFDRHSVMTYGIPAELIEARPNAPSWAKSAATTYGISGPHAKKDLSEGDQKIMAVLYPKPRDFVVSGQITVHAKDDDIGKDDYYDDRDNPRLFQFEHTHHSPLVKYIYKEGYTYIWADEECRVEVHLVVRNFLNNQLELGVYALLYEEEEGDGRLTDDLEDIACKTVRVPLYSSRKVELNLKNRSLFNLKFVDKRCADLYNHGELYLGDVTGGGDWADIVVTFEVGEPITATSLAPSHVSAQEASSMDVNSDGHVDTADLLLVSNYIGETGSVDPRVDVNGDGSVTIADLVLVAQYLGQSTHWSTPVAVTVPTGLQYSIVAGWIDHARAENDGTAAFREGIAKLEYLLTLLIPEETVLLANYPNPFNPETWIPYHLSQPADVTLTIYAVDGKVVRRLDLGHQAAGYYQDKSRAAYWDGRNAIGERVASGLYFYTFTAGDFAATRKMLIMK